jgi:hypothetical protein
MPRATTLLLFTIVAAFPAHLAAEGAVSQDVPVPGGIVAMARGLGLAEAPERARFVAEIARLTYPATEGTQTTRAKAALALRAGVKPQPPIETSSDVVPIPLTVELWSRAVFRRSVAPENIVATIVSDPRAAHLCYGLAGNDDETLQFFANHPDVLRWVYENAAATFAAFGPSLHVHDNHVIPPGPTGSAALWEAVVGETLDRPEAFLRGLLGQDQGRLAYLYDTIAGLDRPRAAFALGLWMKDSGARIDRFKALVGVNRAAFSPWQPAKFPFSRPLHDIALLLSRLQVEPDGTPSFPAGRAAWSWVFENLDLPAEAPRLTSRPDEEPIDAAWMAQNIASGDGDARNDRLDQVAFAQRRFSAADPGALGDVLVAVRAFPRYRMLMLVLERMGVRHAAVYVAAARRAHQLSALGGRRGVGALTQFQGALALLARMADTKTLSTAVSEGLVVSVSNIPLNEDGRYAGGVASWIRRDLHAALRSANVRVASGAPLGGQTDDMEGELTSALAGRRADQTTAEKVAWEGQVYRLDLAAAEDLRLRRVREAQGGPPIDLALDLADIAKKLAAGRLSPDDLVALKVARDLMPSTPDGALHRETMNKAIDELSKAGAQAGTQKIAHVALPVSEIADELLADSLISWAYALSIADAGSPVLLAGNVARRHDFGFDAGPRRARPSTEWAMPRQQIAVGVPWHVTGSLLGLDLALSTLALRRVDGNRVVDPPSMSTNERAAFAESVALMNAYALRDQDRDALADAVMRGRRRVEALPHGDPALVIPVLAEVGMDGWRQQALRWTITHDPEHVESMFSLTELLYLGGGGNVDGNAWGMSDMTSGGCLCTRLAPPNQWRALLGRPQLGLMAVTVPDLNLHIAMTLRELQLPAAVAKSVLTAAVQDFIDEARPTDANDWLTLVRAARTVTRDRIEDYVAAVTADGPLVPDDAADGVQ